MVLLLVRAPSVAAHAILESADPAAGSVVGSSPDELVLDYSEPVSFGDDAVRLFDADGEPVEVGRPEHSDGDGSRLVVDVPTELDDGSYVVSWRVTSADSHPISGAYTFSVGEPSAGESTRSLISGLLAERGSPVVAWTLAILRWLVYAAVSVGVGGWIVARWIWPEGASLDRTRRWILVSLGVAVLASVGAIAAQGAYSAGAGFGAVFEPGRWADVLATRFGQAALVRIAGAGLLMVGVSLVLPKRLRDVLCATAALATVLGVVLANHATTGRWVPVAIGADLLHVAATCAWVGGLVALAVWILVPSPGDEVAGAALPAVRRFSNLATVSVIVLIATGTLQAIRQVGGPTALTTTDYGRTLIVKICIVALLVATAFASRLVVRRWGQSDHRGETADADAELADPDPEDGAVTEPEARSMLRRFVGVEVFLLAGVLAASTLLSNTVPAIEAVEIPFSATVVSSSGVGEFFVDPAKAGTTELHMVMTNPDGSVPYIDEMTVTITLGDGEVGPLEIPMERYQGLPNDYWAEEAVFPFRGTWTIEARGRIGEFDQKVFTTEVRIR